MASKLSKSNEWRVPRPVFARWHELYRFTVDAAAARWNAQLPRFWSKRNSAFKQLPKDERGWCNPPYSRGNLDRWMGWARTAVVMLEADLFAMHVPAYTSEGWWTKTVVPGHGPLQHVDELRLPGFAHGYRRVWKYLATDVWFYEGRVRHQERNGAEGSARHASALVVFGHPSVEPFNSRVSPWLQRAS